MVVKWGTKPLYALLSKTDSGVWGDPGSPDDGVPVLRSTNISNWHLNLSGDLAYRKVNADQIKRYKLEPGDIIVTKSSGSPHLVGQAALFNISTKETYLFSNFMQRLRPNSELVLPEYLLAYLRCPQARSVIERMHRTTSGIRNLKIDDYLAQDVPLPYPDDRDRSLAEQHRIVARLEALLGEVREMRAEIRAMREDLDRLMEAVLEGVFLGTGLEWRNIPLNDLASEESLQIFPANYPNTPFNYWGLDAIQKGQFEEPPPNYIFGSEIRSVCVQFNENHVLYAKLRPYLNKVIVPSVAGIGSTEWIVVKPNPKLDRKYLAYALRTPRFVAYASANMTGTRMPRIRRSAFWEAEIPVPYPDDPTCSLAEQHRIVAYLDAVHEEIKAMRAILDEDERAVDDLEQSILAAAFRGEV